jgi:hypothetical protein
MDEKLSYFKYEIKQRVKEVENESNDHIKELRELVEFSEKDHLNLLKEFRSNKLVTNTNDMNIKTILTKCETFGDKE